MSQPENALTLIFEQKEKIIPVPSSLNGLKQEFIKEFEISSDFPFYLYYKIDTNYDIILNENSFPDFVELNLTKIYAEKKIEENNEEENINCESMNSEFDLVIKELENEIMKINKEKENKRNDKNYVVKSEELEISNDKVNINKNYNSVDEGQIKELKMKIDILTKENLKLKDIEKRYQENRLKIEKSKNIKKELKKIKEKEKEIIFLKNENLKLKNENKQLMENNKIKKEEEKDIKEMEDDFNNEKINMQNEIKTLESIIQIKESEFEEKENRYKKQKKDLKNKIKELQKQLEEKSKNNSIKETASKNSSDIDSMNNKSNVMTASKIKRMKRIKCLNEIYKRNKTGIFRAKTTYKIDIEKKKEEEDKYKEKIKSMKLKCKSELSNTESSDNNIMKSMTFN